MVVYRVDLVRQPSANQPVSGHNPYIEPIHTRVVATGRISPLSGSGVPTELQSRRVGLIHFPHLAPCLDEEADARRRLELYSQGASVLALTGTLSMLKFPNHSGCLKK